LENSLASLAVREGKRRGADDVAATSVKEDAKMIRFANNEVTVSQSWRSTTIYVMVSIRKKVAIGVIEDLSEG
jgi:predicted Zn-dependent protease